MMGQQFYTLSECSQRLGLSVRHLQREIDRGNLVAYKFGRAVRVSTDDVNAYVQCHKQEHAQ